MKKVTKKTKTTKTASKQNLEVVASPTPVLDQKMTPITKLVVAVLILIALSVYAYDKYGAIAIVNGVRISRINYYKTMDKQVGKQTLDNMVLETLILDAADKAGLTVPQTQLDAETAKIEASLKSQGKTLDQALLQEGMKKSDLERQIRIQKIVEELSKTDASVSASEIDSFIAANKDQLPKSAKPEELRQLAEQELKSQASTKNMKSWVENLKATATIIYK